MMGRCESQASLGVEGEVKMRVLKKERESKKEGLYSQSDGGWRRSTENVSILIFGSASK